jgi:hypothetical protein
MVAAHPNLITGSTDGVTVKPAGANRHRGPGYAMGSLGTSKYSW